MRENAQTKGKRYVAEGRLLVDHVANGEIRARYKGDGAVYRLGVPQRQVVVRLSRAQPLQPFTRARLGHRTGAGESVT